MGLKSNNKGVSPPGFWVLRNWVSCALTIPAALAFSSLALASSSPSSPADSRSFSFCESQMVSTSEAIEFTRLPRQLAEFIRRRGPWGQSMGVRFDAQGQPRVFGLESAVNSSKPNITEHGELVMSLTAARREFRFEIDGQMVEIRTAPALVGSAVQSDRYGDLDLESVIIVKYATFTEADLHNPQSIAARALKAYIQEYVLHMLARTHYTLLDFKAGEYDHVPESALKTRSRAIKWTTDEILAGFKMIPTASGEVVRITLEEALTSESRTKIDWSFAAPTHPMVGQRAQISRSDMDTSILFQFGGQRGENTPVLSFAHENHIPEIGATGGHVAIENMSRFSPLRRTTIYYRLEDAELAKQVSLSTPPINLFYTNAHLLDVTRTYVANGDELKAFRRIGRRLSYWNDVGVFNRLHNTRYTALELQRQIFAITESDLIFLLRQLHVIADLRIKNDENGRPDTRMTREIVRGLTTFLREDIEVRPFVPQTLPDTLAGLLEVIDEVTHRVFRDRLDQMPHLRDYMNFVLSDAHQYPLETIETRSYFAALTPNADYIRQYSELLPRLREAYPALDFVGPSDLHMTLSFMGNLTPSQRARLAGAISALKEQIEAAAPTLRNGRLQMMGRNNQVLAVVFDEAALGADFMQAIERLKLEVAQAGVRPDEFFETFLPHITIANIKGAYSNYENHIQVTRILSDPTLDPLHADIQLDPRLDILRTTPPPQTQEDVRRYTDMELSPENILPIVDLDQD